jgi:two-component system NarL family sensor kinase
MISRKITGTVAVFLCLFSFHTHAFDSLDSLKHLLVNDKNDTNKVIHLNSICREYLGAGDFSNALQYGTSSLALAKQINYKKGIANSTNNIGIINFNQRNYEKALEYFSTSLKLRLEIGNKNDIATSYNNLGLIYWHLGNYTLALQNHTASLKTYEEIGDTKFITNAYNNIGSTYYSQGNYDKALENYFTALKIQEELADKNQKPDKYSIAAACDGIGGVLTAEKKYDQALEYYKKVLDAVQALNRRDKIVVALNNIGSTYMFLNKDDSALVFHNKALAIAIQTKDSIGEASALGEIGAVYKKIKKYDMALQVLQSSYSILKGSNNKIWMGELLSDIGAILTEQKQYKASIDYLKDAKSLLQETGNKNHIKDVYYNLSRAYEGVNDYKNAYENYTKYTLYKDSIFNNNMVAKTTEMQTKYETEKKEKEIVAQKEQIGKQNFRLLTVVIVSISVIIIVLLISYVFYNRYRTKQKTELNQMLLDEQKMRTKAIIDAQEEDRKRVAKDLHDSVGQLLFILRMNLEKADKYAEKKLTSLGISNVKDSIKMVDDANIELRNIALKMMPRTLNETGISGAVNDLLDKTLKNTGISYNFESFLNGKNFDEHIKIGVFRIFQEILSNILKHAQATEINVHLHIVGKQLIVIIEDNGIKFNFDIQTAKAHIPKTGNTGMGLLNIAIRAEALNGTVLYEPSPIKGTITTIKIPI